MELLTAPDRGLRVYANTVVQIVVAPIAMVITPIAPCGHRLTLPRLTSKALMVSFRGTGTSHRFEARATRIWNMCCRSLFFSHNHVRRNRT
jgi:hypothetical protein